MTKRMTRAGTPGACCGPACRVEAVIGVDARGQMVLPKPLRDRIGLRPGGKVAVISWQGSDGACCLSLVNTGALTGLASRFLGPLVQALTRQPPTRTRR